MSNIIIIIQLISAVLLIFLVLLQNQGKGIGRAWGSNSFTRRGLEKIVFRGTFVLASIFIIVSFLRFII